MNFTPLADFYCEELKSHYCVGLSYTLKRADDPAIAGPDKRSTRTRQNRATLAKLLPVWLQEGKVTLGLPVAPVSGAARVSGQGDVTGGS